MKKYAIIGGDLRNIKLADLMIKEGNEVNLYGFKQASFTIDINESETIVKAIEESDIVIGPLPCSNDNETLHTPFHDEKIYIHEIFKQMKKNQLFIAGKVSEEINTLARNYEIHCIDILEREEMSILNAIPTAEGAIQIAMEEMPITLHQCNAFIMGFGRIGKVLSHMLQGLGVNVYVEARKYSDIAWIRTYGYIPILISDINQYMDQMDVIFNTVPCVILKSPSLEKCKKDTLLIDLASKPGGIDFNKAKELGLKVIWALSLPGKVAPVTAAGFIKNTIDNIVEELGV